MKRSDHDLLHRSLDSSLTPGEKSRLDAALQRDPGLRDEYERLMRLRGLLEGQESPSFREGFSRRVMDRLDRLDRLDCLDLESTVGPALDFQDSLSLMFRRVAVAASIAAILLLTYNLATSDSVSLTASFGLSEELYPEDLYDARIALETEGAL